MNKQQRKNIGLNTTFIVIASVIGLSLLLFFIIPGNRIHDSPILNKFLSALFAAGAVYYGIGWSKDKWWNNITKDSVYFWLNFGIFVGLLLLSLLTLTVFYGGVLGLTTNPE
jgi:hypothetical protein